MPLFVCVYKCKETPLVPGEAVALRLFPCLTFFNYLSLVFEYHSMFSNSFSLSFPSSFFVSSYQCIFVSEKVGHRRKVLDRLYRTYFFSLLLLLLLLQLTPFGFSFLFLF
uniref:Uncharacterized protein n=1 Tax=Trypanosoma vivax (strain Y486) TaxID=1055687 RepID=G0TWE0_TRYVY|nr:hypothetical protein TVY486_0600690 [Trypanosoma vivax Y486]